jgi:hypothetical protein
VQLLKASFKRATKKGYLARSPISEDSALKRAKIARRNRRLQLNVLDKDGKLQKFGEERRLLAPPARGYRTLSSQRWRAAAGENCCSCSRATSASSGAR